MKIEQQIALPICDVEVNVFERCLFFKIGNTYQFVKFVNKYMYSFFIVFLTKQNSIY